MNPVLPTQSARLVPAVDGDLDRICALLWDRQVRRFLCDDTKLPKEHVAALIERSQASTTAIGLWCIETPGDGFVGVCGLQAPTFPTVDPQPFPAGALEPLIALDPRAWGRGLAEGAIAALAMHARSGGAPMLLAAVDEPNVRSRRLMTRCGFGEVDRVQGPAHMLVIYERRL